MSGNIDVKSVLVIGAGPSGLAAAKYLLAESHFTRIVVAEQRDTIGGLWNHAPAPDQSRDADVKIVPQGDASRSGPSDCFISPIYDRLQTNIPKQIMRYSDLEFPHQSPNFPRHETVNEYLHKYGQEVLHLVHLQTQVTNVEVVSRPGEEDSWKVTSVHLPTNKFQSQLFGAVVCANGHFNTPFTPDIPGLSECQRRFPDLIIHSKYFRKPETFAEKKVIIVGNGASSADISHQVSQYATAPTLVSVRGELDEVNAERPASLLYVSTIRYLDAESRIAILADGAEHPFDAIILCTGYYYSMPFFRSEPALSLRARMVQNSYKHIFYTPHPTLAFLCLPVKVVPFLLAECQATVVARVFSGRLKLPSHQEMLDWEMQVIEEQGERGRHEFSHPRDLEYMNMLIDWAEQAQPGPNQDKSPRAYGDKDGWPARNFAEWREATSIRMNVEEKNRSLMEHGLVDY